MNNYHSLIVISNIFILAVCIQSQDSKGPGIALCSFFGERSEGYCGLSKVLITDVPEKCSSVIFLAVYMDLNYNATDANYSSDFTLLDDMLNSGKRVLIYYVHEPEEWATILASNSSNEGNNSFDEMKALKGFFDEHPKIAGIILLGLDYQTDEIPELSENFKKYLELMKKTFPELLVSVEFRGKILIDQYTNPLMNRLDIHSIGSAMDFYVISQEFFNPCTTDFRNTGIAPMNGSNTNYTLEKLVEALQNLKFPNEKIYFKFEIVPTSSDELESTCNMTNEKGKFSADNGAGFMVRYIDLDDPDNRCQCKTPYLAFNAILDGFNNVETKTCNLFNRGPGISSCIFLGGRTEVDCGLSEVLITDVPDKCTSVIYFGVYMDLEYNATNSKYTSDFTLLDDMLNSGKRVMIYYRHVTQEEWATVLTSNSSNEGNNSFDEMKALKGFFDEHPKIAGIILAGLQYDSESEEIPELSENFKKYLELIKNTFTELVIGVEFQGTFLIDHYTNPMMKSILDDMLNSGKRVLIYYIHMHQEWATILANNSSNEGNNSFDEMKALKGFFEKHPKIAGIILAGLQYDSESEEIPELSANFKSYLELMKNTYTELMIGLDVRGQFLIDHYTNPMMQWLDISFISSAVDFYVISQEFFNPCTIDLRNTGIAPMNGSKANYTLEKLEEALQQLHFPNEKLYFNFRTNPTSPNESLTICDVITEKMCVQPQLACDWCADTQLSYNEKGKFSQKNGAGFMVRYIDYDDPDNCCRCENPYPAFNAILDGFNGVETKICDLLKRV